MNALYLYKDGCQYCEKMNPIWDDIANSMQDVKFTKIESKDPEIDQYKNLPGFNGFPFFAVFQTGKPARYVVGSTTKADLVKKLFGRKGGRRTRHRSRRFTRRLRRKF